jgi:hypothetical protein
MKSMSRSVRARCISGSLVVLSCLSGQIVLGQTATLESASPAAVERAVATPDANAAQAPGPGLLGPTTTTWPGKTPNFFKATLTDFRNLSSNKETLTWLAIGAAAASLTRPVDQQVTNQVSTAPAMEQFRAGNIIGGKEFQFGASVTALAIAKLTGSERASDVAGKVLRAQILSQAVTGVIKKAAQRERPDGSDTRSFPSGHTSVSFASATVLQREFGWKIGIPAYAAATYVGTARIEKKKHFLSDVAFGAAIGILSGRTVTIGSGNKKFSVTPVAAPGGVGVGFTYIGQ